MKPGGWLREGAILVLEKGGNPGCAVDGLAPIMRI